MIRPRRYFPWKIARQYFISHFVFVVVTMVLTGFSLRYYAYEQFTHATDIHSALARFDSYLSSLFVTVSICAALYVALLSRTYARPLGRLIQRARELRRLDTPVQDLDSEEFQTEEPGEWSDLEKALARVHKDLRQKTDQLSREREELSALIGAVSDAILAIDLEGRPLFFNTQFAMLFQSKVRNELRLSEIFRSPEILQSYREVLKSGEMRMVSTVLHVRETEERRQFSVSISPLMQKETDTVFGAIGVFHDITEIKATENLRVEFVSNASHELRTPITNIKGYVDTLRDDLKKGRHENTEQFLDIITRNVDRLVFLISDLLDLSTLESGGELKRDTVSVQEITETALRQVEAKRALRKQEVVPHYNIDAVYGDPRRIEQVIVNLVQNAIKYIPEGSRVDIIWDVAEDGSTILRIKDNGPGIAPEHHSRLFERFYRVDSGRSRDMGGTGLGLAIAKHIMIKHGGNIKLVSRMGEGAEFLCTFPE